MPSKKKPVEAYNKDDIEKKVNKLCKLYDLSKPEDLFTILPQEMELAEARGLYYGSSGEFKKKGVMDIILAIADKNSINLNKEILSVFIDTINSASKGKYALNKEQIHEKTTSNPIT